jgi:hypothetical protein
MTTKNKVRRYLARGLSAKEIAKKLGIDAAYVHTIKYQDKKTSNLIGAVFDKTRAVRKTPSESRREVFNITMPKIEAEVRDVKAAMDFLDADSITTRKFTKAEMSALDKNWIEFPSDYVVGSDRVNSPPHYTAGGIETIDFIEAKDLNYRLGNVVKYVSRAEKKENPLEDLKKAKWYLEREIATRERA